MQVERQQFFIRKLLQVFLILFMEQAEQTPQGQHLPPKYLQPKIYLFSVW